MNSDVKIVQLEKKVSELEDKIDLLFSPELKYSNVRPIDDPNYDKKLTKRKEDAGYDVWCSYFDDKTNEKVNGDKVFMNKDSNGNITIKIPQFTTGMIPLGVATAIDSNFALSLKHERSSVGSKGLFVNAGLIDSGYRDGWNIVITPIAGDLIISSEIIETKVHRRSDTGDTKIYYPYSKAIGQIIVVHNIDSQAEEIPYDDLLNITSERGTDGWGSTN